MEKPLPTSEVHELAAGYALGALDAPDRAAFEEHLLGGCPLCETELGALNGMAGELAASIAAPPPAGLRARLLERVRTSRAAGALPDGVIIARSAKVPWRPMAEGVAFKILHRDKARRYSTSLVRMDAGASLPRHRHKDIEELYILSGDLRVSGETVYAGDYCRADTGSVHEESFSETGCLFLLMASQDNEVLA
jgi:anti-sigma factor ChrR (cupin superfamily)